MNVQFKETKTNKIYEDFVKEPTDRKKQRAFTNSSVIKSHQKL